MKVKKIELHNFRSYEKLEMAFNSGCSIIVGPNATGKSSILEAFCVLGTTKSFRKAKDSDLVRFGEKNFYKAHLAWQKKGKEGRRDGEE